MRYFTQESDLLTAPYGFEAGDTNLRRYVGNNATNGIDPTGLQDKEKPIATVETTDDYMLYALAGLGTLPSKDKFIFKDTIKENTAYSGWSRTVKNKDGETLTISMGKSYIGKIVTPDLSGMKTEDGVLYVKISFSSTSEYEEIATVQVVRNFITSPIIVAPGVGLPPLPPATARLSIDGKGADPERKMKGGYTPSARPSLGTDSLGWAMDNNSFSSLIFGQPDDPTYPFYRPGVGGKKAAPGMLADGPTLNFKQATGSGVEYLTLPIGRKDKSKNDWEYLGAAVSWGFVLSPDGPVPLPLELITSTDGKAPVAAIDAAARLKAFQDKKDEPVILQKIKGINK